MLPRSEHGLQHADIQAVSKGSGNGSYKPKNLEDGADSKAKVEVMRQFCFVTEVRGLAKHLSGNRNNS